LEESARNKEDDIWIMLDQAHAAIYADREKELRQYNLSTMKSAVLFCINQIGSEVTPAELSRWLLRRSHSVSGLLNRMEKDGLIKKTKDLHRKNLVRVTITEKGKQAYKDSLKSVSIRVFIPGETKEYGSSRVGNTQTPISLVQTDNLYHTQSG